jgi:membrane protease YdiL (CAAX protease family)
MSVADVISSEIGTAKIIPLPVGLLLSAILLIFLKKHELFAEYGLCRPRTSARSMLWYLPLVLMLTANLWHGAEINRNTLDTVLYVETMLCIGFLEEIIFRGLLFGAMRKDSEKVAVIVSSLTFGIGHVINMINGSGAELIPNLLQIVYATAAGFMFVMIYKKTQSLLVCIAAHGLSNALGAFAASGHGIKSKIVTAVLLTLITGGYAIYIALTMKNKVNEDQE